MRFFAFVPILFLLGCVSQQQACISSATRDLRNLTKLIEESQATLKRGYEIRTETQHRQVLAICKDTDGNSYTCFDFEEVPVRRNVAVDLNAERAKLNSMLRKQAQLEREAKAQIAACEAAYPEG